MLTNSSVLLVVLALLVIAISITVHEFMHGLSSHILGDDTAKLSGRLTLNPLKHIDLFTTVLLPVVLILLGYPPFGAAKPVPFNPSKVKYNEFGVAIVGVSGPLSNLVLAVIGGVILRVVGTLNSELWTTWWWLFVVINIGFFLFNLIPFPPLDGSRVLYAFAPAWLQRMMNIVESLGFMAIVVFMLVLFPLLSPILQTLDKNLVGFVIGT